MSELVLTAFDAYRYDVAASGRPTLGDNDAGWLRMADLLERAARTRRRATRAPGRRVPGRARGGRQATDTVQGDDPFTTAADGMAKLAATLDALRAVLEIDVASDTDRSSVVGYGAATDQWPHTTAPGTTPSGTPCDAAAATALLDAVAAAAQRMEAAGALALAAWVLATGCEVLPEANAAARAFVAVLRGRVARKRGDLTYADDLYATAARLGRVGRAPAVVAQATLGRGVVARRRGDYPSARRAFVAGVHLARSAGRRDLESAGHQGLLVAAAAAHDFATALHHGWAALELATGNPDAEADALANLAAVAGDLGDHRAAVRGYLAAATRVRSPQVRVPALAGAAVSAGALGDAALVLRLEALLSPALNTAQLPYEAATGWALLARARRHLGDETRAAAYTTRARDLAVRHAFHELALTLDADAPVVPGGRQPAARAPASVGSDRRVAAVLGDLAGVALGPEWAPDTPLGAGAVAP